MRIRHRLAASILGALAVIAVAAPAAPQGYDPSEEQRGRIRAYDAALATLKGDVDAWRSGDYLIFIHEVNGRKVRLLVPKSQFADTVAGMVLLGDIEPEEVPALVRLAQSDSDTTGNQVFEDYARIKLYRDQMAGAPPDPLPPVASAPPADDSDTAAAPSGLWLGMFDSDRGLMSIVNSPVRGGYANPPGSLLRINGAAGGNTGATATGYWIQTSSERACPEDRDFGRYYGRFLFSFTAQGFTGKWGYCHDDPTMPWNGRRRTPG